MSPQVLNVACLLSHLTRSSAAESGPIHVTPELLAKGIKTKMGVHPNRNNPPIRVRRNQRSARRVRVFKRLSPMIFRKLLTVARESQLTCTSPRLLSSRATKACSSALGTVCLGPFRKPPRPKHFQVSSWLNLTTEITQLQSLSRVFGPRKRPHNGLELNKTLGKALLFTTLGQSLRFTHKTRKSGLEPK